jgi:hypothetical protein
VAPSQLEIDLLAVFIETAEELRHEPFFDLYENTRYSTQDKKLYVIEFGDRFHFRSALIPFRRMWRKGEDSYYADILDLIVKYEPSAAGAAASFRNRYEQLETDPALSPHVSSPGKEVVDSWLYSVFVHTNLKRSRTGREPMTEKFSSRTPGRSDTRGTNMHFEKPSGALDGCTSTFLIG